MTLTESPNAANPDGYSVAYDRSLSSQLPLLSCTITEPCIVSISLPWLALASSRVLISTADALLRVEHAAYTVADYTVIRALTLVFIEIYAE